MEVVKGAQDVGWMAGMPRMISVKFRVWRREIGDI